MDDEKDVPPEGEEFWHAIARDALSTGTLRLQDLPLTPGVRELVRAMARDLARRDFERETGLRPPSA